MIPAKKPQKTQLQKRRRSIIIALVAIAALAVACIFVLSYVKTMTYTDVDGKNYFIKYKNKQYAMYDKEGLELI